MTRKTSPSLEAQAAAALAAGWPLSAVAEQTGLSVSTVKRIKTRTGARSGALRPALIADAKAALREALSAEYVAIESASLIRSQVALSNTIQTRTAELLEHLQIDGETDPLKVARALSAIATAVKLSADSLRQVFSLGSPPEQVEHLPELVVRELAPEEEKSIRETAGSAVVAALTEDASTEY